MLVGLGGVIISPAGNLLYFPLDCNALLGEAKPSVDSIIDEWGESNEIGLNSEEIVISLNLYLLYA